MTCIVGIECNDRVFIAGDLQGTGGNNKIMHTQPKVFKKGGVAFGYTTSYRFGQILEHNLPDPVVPADDSEIYRWLISVLIPDIKKTLVDNGWTTGGTCLIGVKNQLWTMQDDFSVLRSVKGYDACGSGVEYAVGCMFTFLNINPNITEKNAIAALTEAVKTAGTFSPSVGTECSIVVT